ncbi:MAG: class B sortase [Butyricicoccus sp.]|nr:class B sortase [Butyricicoccus sp.]
MKHPRLLYWSGISFCVMGLFFCAGMFLRAWWEYRTGVTAYAMLEKEVIEIMPQLHAEEPVSASAAPAQPAEEAFQVDFNALSRINPDVVGWLYVPDTVISYPVVQGGDNAYYLTHLFDGTQNRAGCLFLDRWCQGLEGKNSVIYGHAMKNGTLFASLKQYQNQSYYEAHPLLYLYTPEKTLTIRLFSAYETDTKGDAWRLSFSSEERTIHPGSRNASSAPVLPARSTHKAPTGSLPCLRVATTFQTPGSFVTV